VISSDFLEGLEWEERWLELEAIGEVDLPAYAGSTVRGALGTVLRRELCDRGGGVGCGEQCEAPESCRFFRLFEQSRMEGGGGGNIPKPLILEAPLAEEMHAIARGATVGRPYELQAGMPLPVLENRWRLGIPNGERLEFGLRGLGVAGAALDGVVEGVRQCGLAVKGGRLALRSVRGGRCRFAPAPVVGDGRRLRLALLTPTLIRGEKGICYEPERLGRIVLDQALLRAVALWNAFFATERTRIPFVRPERPGVVMTSHRLFRYRLPRHSYRQEQWMDFDGVVGWMEWEGDVEPLVPWLHAAEVLHIGQKATFGLGRVQLLEG